MGKAGPHLRSSQVPRFLLLLAAQAAQHGALAHPVRAGGAATGEVAEYRGLAGEPLHCHRADALGISAFFSVSIC